MDITQIIVALIGLCTATITVFGGWFIKEKIGEKRWDKFLSIVDVAVDAAEQLGYTGKIQNKFEYAMSTVKNELLKKGLKYDDDIIRAAIEASVLYLEDDDDDQIQA